mmetsp:Transcript_6963/g.8383  ORF Transcript_6963/g.8383 Transcript_6963/m.8383 type:complete len:208 (-) Transcript_6963:284-907(-)
MSSTTEFYTQFCLFIGDQHNLLVDERLGSEMALLQAFVHKKPPPSDTGLNQRLLLHFTQTHKSKILILLDLDFEIYSWKRIVVQTRPHSISISDEGTISNLQTETINLVSDNSDNDQQDINDDANEEVEVVGFNGNHLPHSRQYCTIDKFDITHPQNLNHQRACEFCYCWVCDIHWSQCLSWSYHCEAHDKSSWWREFRAKKRQKNK